MTELSIILLARWALITLGLIYFVTESAIFMRPRVWIANRGAWAMLFVYCAACTGFWIGAASALWLWPFAPEPAWTRLVEGGIAAMTLGAIWKRLNGGNPAFTVEAELLHDHTPQKEEESNGRREAQDA